jgi:ABC-type transport system involved in multi-copper enzyme maturation permease subunit
MIHPLLAVLELEREPLKFAELGAYVKEWLQDAGGFAALGLVFYLLFTRTKRDSVWAKDQTKQRVDPWIWVCFIVACVAYGAAGVFRTMEPPPPAPPVQANPDAPKPPPPPLSPQAQWRINCMAIGGAAALLGLGLPFLFDLVQMRWARIWALAKLSFKEAVRRKVLWVFLAFLLLFLFPPKWFIDIKKEDEVRNAVSVVEFAMSAIMILAFGLLAAFSIPNDLRNQTMYTIVTKPVQRFEIILGRFLGYVGLATIVLLVLRALSLLLIWASNPSSEAINESFQARDPVYGELKFIDRNGEVEGWSVGREWDYRRYVPGGANSSHRAVFTFNELPSHLAKESAVIVEFSFDIFRTFKGEENKGVQASLFFETPAWSESRRPDYDAEIKRLGLSRGRIPRPEDPDWDKWNQIAEKFGYFEAKGREIADYHTFQQAIPGGLFRSAIGMPGPPLVIKVKCDSRSQFLGVAKRDLFLLANNYSFAVNFMKGAFGLWLMLVLVIGLAVTMSTYLSGVVSWLTSMFIVLIGFFRPFIEEIAEGKVIGGGPSEALVRLYENQNLLTPLDNSPGAQVAMVVDVGFQWMFRRLLNLVPDVERFDWSMYVAEGFNIPWSEMALSLLLLLGYLLPWALVGYYLMKSREVAN